MFWYKQNWQLPISAVEDYCNVFIWGGGGQGDGKRSCQELELKGKNIRINSIASSSLSKKRFILLHVWVFILCMGVLPACVFITMCMSGAMDSLELEVQTDRCELPCGCWESPSSLSSSSRAFLFLSLGDAFPCSCVCLWRMAAGLIVTTQYKAMVSQRIRRGKQKLSIKGSWAWQWDNLRKAKYLIGRHGLRMELE